MSNLTDAEEPGHGRVARERERKRSISGGRWWIAGDKDGDGLRDREGEIPPVVDLQEVIFDTHRATEDAPVFRNAGEFYGNASLRRDGGRLLCDARACLLYTSDAAVERSSVDLGGRRIITKHRIKTDDAHKRLAEANGIDL